MQPGRLFLQIISGLTALTAMLTLPQAVLAFTLTVTDVSDATDTTPGDGICDTGSAICTLRAAIQEANAFPGQDEIIIPTGTYTLTRSGSDNNATNGDLDITDDLVLSGAGASLVTIDANSLDRAIDIRGDRTVVTITGVTITGGSAAGGGGVANAGTLTVTDSVIDNNSAFNAPGGGGIYSTGTLTLDNVTVSNNTATGSNGGGMRIDSPDNTTTISRSLISGNSTAQTGGGMYISNGTVNITESTIDGNTAPLQFAGAIDNSSTLTITRSTISNNSAANAGGIRTTTTGPPSPTVSLTMSNSTISGNETPELYNGGSQATGGDGGGLYLNGDASLTNVTIADNRANFNGGGIYQISGKTLDLSNTLIADNTTGFPTISPPALLNNCSINGTVTSAGANLDNDASCSLGGSGDITAVTNLPLAGFSALADNGGFTLTHAIDNTSEAYDAGTTATGTDQRGVDRASQTNRDIGAYLRTGSEGVWTDLGLQVAVSASPVQVNDTIQYTVTATNYGPNAATAFTIDVTMPAGMTGSGSGCSSGSTMTCSVASLAVGATASFSIASTAPATLSIPYSALTFTAAINTTQSDLNSANDSVSIGTDLASTSDLSVNISASTPDITLGQPFNYRYQVSNNGAAIRAVTLISELPSTVSLSGSLPGGCSIDGQTVTCDLGDMDDGDNNLVVLSVVPNTGDPLSNTAYVNFGGVDSNPADNEDTLDSTVNLKSVDLKLTGAASAAQVIEGNNISYTYTVENKTGSNNATGVTLDITVPADATVNAINSERDNRNNTLFTCSKTVGITTDIHCLLNSSLAAGSSVFVTIVATANVGGKDYIVSAITDSALAVDGNPADNDSDIMTTVIPQTVIPPQTDLDVTISSNPATATTGENIAYTASVLNIGPDFADGILLTIHLPAGMTIGTVPLGCTKVSNRMITCSTWTLGVNQQVSAKIVVKANNSGDYVVSAEAVNNNGQDGNPDNNFDTVVTTVSGVVAQDTGGFTPKAGSGSIDVLLLAMAGCLLGLRRRSNHAR